MKINEYFNLGTEEVILDTCWDKGGNDFRTLPHKHHGYSSPMQPGNQMAASGRIAVLRWHYQHRRSARIAHG